MNIIGPTFDSKEDAIDWMDGQVDDPCTDNYRFAFEDDDNAVILYEDIQSEGCCGSFDATIVVDGRTALIGCNYGH